MDIKPSKSNQNQSQAEWYIFRDCQQHGPLTVQEIRTLLYKNQINSDHHVWHSDFNDWVSIHEVEAFKNIEFGIKFAAHQSAFIEDTEKPKLHLEDADFINEQPKTLSVWKKIKSIFNF